MKKKTKNEKKLEKVYAICTNAQKKYNLTPLKTERCIMKLKKKFHVTKEPKKK
jgi:hypothetical protein